LTDLSIRDLIKAGFHFGHRTSRWNPEMGRYIFKRRNLIHIIDLRETLRGLIVGRRLSRVVAARGSYVLFAGTKKQARSLTEREARRCAMPYVCERWPGGLLTNYATVRGRLERLEELESLERTGEIRLYSNKMISSLRRERRKIVRNLGGVRQMDRLPGLLVAVDPVRERIAVREAQKLDIPIIALTDTDGDPEDIDVVVPGNDDSIAAIDIFLTTMCEGVMQGLADRGVGTPGKAVAPAPPQPDERRDAIGEPDPEGPAEEGQDTLGPAASEGEAGPDAGGAEPAAEQAVETEPD
jgi:small subunit ribosomal protein S2